MGDEVVENKGTGSYFLGQFAHLGLSVKHVALGTTELVGLLDTAEELLLLSAFSFTFVGIILLKCC